jgi:hypothetical protein
MIREYDNIKEFVVELNTFDNRLKKELDEYFDDIYKEYLDGDLNKKLVILTSLCVMQTQIDNMVNGGHYG